MPRMRSYTREELWAKGHRVPASITWTLTERKRTQAAADLEGVTWSDFVRRSALGAADRVLNGGRGEGASEEGGGPDVS